MKFKLSHDEIETSYYLAGYGPGSAPPLPPVPPPLSPPPPPNLGSTYMQSSICYMQMKFNKLKKELIQKYLS